MNYFHEVKTDKYIASVDKIRFSFQLLPDGGSGLFSIFDNPLRVDVKVFPPSFTQNQYKQMAIIDYGESTMTIGLGFNGVHAIDLKKCFVEFNPNKVANNPQFWKDFNLIKSCSKTWELVRCDIACDFFIDRRYVHLEKDNRKYSLEAFSFDNRTEYLGKRNTCGRVKVYNKSLESKLNYPLTRVEVTCNGIKDFADHFPRVYDLTPVLSGQMDIDSLIDLKDTDFALLELLRIAIEQNKDNGLMLFNRLGRYKKEKLKPYILPESSSLGVSLSSIASLFNQISVDYNITL